MFGSIYTKTVTSYCHQVARVNLGRFLRGPWQLLRVCSWYSPTNVNMALRDDRLPINSNRKSANFVLHFWTQTRFLHDDLKQYVVSVSNELNNWPRGNKTHKVLIRSLLDMSMPSSCDGKEVHVAAISCQLYFGQRKNLHCMVIVLSTAVAFTLRHGRILV